MGIRRRQGARKPAARRGGFGVLVATDGSPQARAAVAVTVAFPWPRAARAHAVVARHGFVGAFAGEWPAAVWAALDARLLRLARATARALRRRWPDAEAVVVDRLPVEGILARARRVGARVIVVGSRGHGVLGRFVLGSVSRDVVRRAGCPVLVVRGRPRAVRRLLVGLDGSANARRAVDLVARFPAPRGGRVTLLSVLEPVRLPAIGLLPVAVRGGLRGQAAAAAAERRRAARREVDAAARRLARAGWRARAVVAEGVPLEALLAGVRATRADVLVLGARGAGRIERLLLGSVAEGALGRSPVSVLIVK